MPSHLKTRRQRDIFRQWNYTKGWQKLVELVSSIETTNSLYYAKDKLSDDEYADRLSMLHGQVQTKLKSLGIPINAKSRIALRHLFCSLEKSFTYSEAQLATQQFAATCLKRA
jgi:hypothetical protein